MENYNDSSSTIIADKMVIIKNDPSHFNNGGFTTGFSEALLEIAKNKDLTKLEHRMIVLILSFMGNKDIKLEGNRQRLLGYEYYCKYLGMTKKSKGHISTAFKNLEDFGYIKRDKGDACLEVMINPAFAYSGAIKDYNKIWNETANIFGNPVRKIKGKKEEDNQDWDSHLEPELSFKKRVIKQHNLDGGIDDIEVE